MRKSFFTRGDGISGELEVNGEKRRICLRAPAIDATKSRIHIATTASASAFAALTHLLAPSTSSSSYFFTSSRFFFTSSLFASRFFVDFALFGG